ncbi:hypothetical protein HGRIS_010823 [Hohenbuehelia grisea]|uniref:Uncharacterized protein n=1 Tax=Hohenbuehelia grisea TaxID=104357 RepID=A0ABR3IXY3_9AGAR
MKRTSERNYPLFAPSQSKAARKGETQVKPISSTSTGTREFHAAHLSMAGTLPAWAALWLVRTTSLILCPTSVLYRMLTNDIDAGKFDLERSPSWLSSLRICSLVFNTWSLDYERHYNQRRAHPTVLDWGFSSVDSLQDLDQMTTHDLKVEGDLKNQKERTVFTHGTTEILRAHEREDDPRVPMRDRLNDLLRTTELGGPILLLVHDEELTRNALRDLGIDSSQWESGIRKLLWTDRPHDDYKDNRRYQSNDYYNRDTKRYHRNRSRSPQRSGNNYHPHTRDYHKYKEESPSRAGPSNYGSYSRNSYAPVYVVDIQQSFIKLFQTKTNSAGVRTMAKALVLLEGDNDGPEDGWCAGTESRQIIEVWRSMASGAPIDDQRALRFATRGNYLNDQGLDFEPPEGADGEPGGAGNGDFDDEDDDRDPNDLAAAHRQNAGASGSAKPSLQGGVLQHLEQLYAGGGDDYDYDEY